MNAIILTILSALLLLAAIMIILASKLVLGANAENIIKGKPTKSRDELRREIKILQIIMFAFILIFIIIGIVVLIIL